MIRISTAVCVAACLGASAASAGIETSPVLSTGPFGTDASGGLINLPLFDSHLGTLEAVSISLTGTFSGGAFLNNNGHMPDSFTFNIGGQAGVDIISSDPSAAAADLKAFVFDTSMPKVSYNLAKSAQGAYGPYLIHWGSIAITGLPVADFEAPGGGTVALHIDETSFPVDSPGVIELNDVFYEEQNLQATAQMQVTYRYLSAPSVPEPATWAMMLTGFVLLGAALRSRSVAQPGA